MKYAIFGIVIAVLGLGEYAYVELAPFPPNTRIRKLRKIPVVTVAVEAWQVARIYERAENGNSYSYFTLYQEGRSRGDLKMMQRAEELLRSSETATAKWLLYSLTKPWDRIPLWELEEERLVLFFQYVTEKLPVPDVSERSQKQWEEACDDYLKQLFDRVEQGEERAQRIVAALEDAT